MQMKRSVMADMIALRKPAIKLMRDIMALPIYMLTKVCRKSVAKTKVTRSERGGGRQQVSVYGDYSTARQPAA